MTREEKIKSFMSRYEINREEAITMVDYDEETDKMSMKEINADLTDEQKKAVKNATKTISGKPTERKPREKKVDETKKNLIEIVRSTLFENEIYCQVTNDEKTIDFNLNGANYTFTLTKHREKSKY